MGPRSDVRLRALPWPSAVSPGGSCPACGQAGVAGAFRWLARPAAAAFAGSLVLLVWHSRAHGDKIVSVMMSHCAFKAGSPTDLWQTILRNVWAQWRYENDVPDYYGPNFEVSSHSVAPALEPIESGEVDILAFCGGGKDSLVAMKLLERGGGGFDSLAYSSTCYGRSHVQHELLGSLLDHGSPQHRRLLWIFDDFLDSPVLHLGIKRGIPKTLTAAETPSSVFAAIPFALQYGYRYLQLVVCL